MDTLQGTVERIIFRDDENGYTVAQCSTKGCSEFVSVGIMPGTFAGSILMMEGQWKNDRKYGRQFSVSKYKETMPSTIHGIEKYLGSGLIRGVGTKTANKIVKTFGEDTLDVLNNDPDRLVEIEGLGAKRAQKIKVGWLEQKEVKNIMIFLQSCDISTGMAAKIYDSYGDESIKVVSENPYRLADDIWGIGFKTADQIAKSLGIGKTKFIRLRSGLIYTLNSLSNEGHCYAERGQLINAAKKLLDVDEEVLEMTLDEVIRTSDVIQDGDAIYLSPYYYAEIGCANRLKRLMSAEAGYQIDADKAVSYISSDIDYDDDQMDAIRQAASSKVMVLTGGPGTGKTTTTLGIISAYKSAGCKVLLAAPTGRAAKRMSEVTGMDAQTIHRLLEYNKQGFQRNEDNPLYGDVLIVDECSMIDILLMNNLLKAVPKTMSLILVGDVDQLPSVGAGNVFKDIIDSGCIPVARLEKVFRQAQGSLIITNAHRINQGEMPVFKNKENPDFYMSTKATDEEIAQEIVRLCTEALPKVYHADPLKDIQVLAPMKKGTCGTMNLNTILQEAMNPSGLFIKHKGTVFRMNDKVMQIRNNYDKGVFNGNVGVISGIDLEENRVIVDYDGNKIYYEDIDLDELILAYASTIHKAQGSEYPIVVMPMTCGHQIMLQRNLLYTGVTRAKKILVLVGTKKAVGKAVENESVALRNTMLAERLQDDTESWRENKKAQADVPEEFRDLFFRLAESDEHRSISLNANEIASLKDKGSGVILDEIRASVRKRLAPAIITNDGRQTPKLGSPVFIAQHATGTCCRGCLEKWHHIPKGKELTEEQQTYVVDIILTWINAQVEKFECTV